MRSSENYEKLAPILIRNISIFSFTMGTETKSGCIVKTPGKFSTCVSGKRKHHKGKKVSANLDLSVTSFAHTDIASSSMMVNTSQLTETDIQTNHYDDDNITASQVNDSVVDNFSDRLVKISILKSSII